jgi:two-component system, NtrC family, sensor kinase
MNQNLQNILDAIQQNGKLSEDEKKSLLKSLKDADKELEITAFKLERTEKVKKTTAILLEETIEELEQKRKAVEESNTALQMSLEELKAAQAKLIHAEKMASLGELTAGIAHEIKNPLNFVNNFSDLSRELIDEVKEELKNNNNEEVLAILEDLKQNLEKINQHGKRADSIVKGMLLHSRGSSGEKTLTDINDLLDQYVNLAYHGMRAQNKEFNISIEKDYDKTLEKINVIPQDFSRVFLNIINNACYAAYERKKLSSDGFDPVLNVSTKNLKNKVEIRIGDNGNGIPANIIDKIFQPFFTTKPTGEGTGLGLSLSYDIVTKVHGGELKVETKEGKGTEFIICFPI